MRDIRTFYFNDFESLRDEWLRFEKEAVLYYFQSFLWLSNWFDNIGKRNNFKPLIVAVYNNKDLIAIFPCCIERKYLIFNVITWMGDILADYNAPVFSKHLSEEERREIASKVIKELSGIKDIDFLLFQKNPEYLDDGMINPMNYADIITPCTHPEDYLYAPYIVLTDWESIYRKVNKRKRSESSRFRRRLTDMGTVGFRLAKNLHEVEEVTKVTIMQKTERLLMKGKKHFFEDSNYKNFYMNTGLKAYNEGYLHLSWLKLNEEIIATHWGILFNSRLYWLVPSFDYNYRNNTPGRLLLEEVIRWCCDNKVKCFDFCLGDEQYKKVWTDTKMRLYRYIKPITTKGNMFDKLYRNVRPALKRMKDKTS